ncbi:MAG: Gldg family protein [Cyanobacteria bacterium J06632_3]
MKPSTFLKYLIWPALTLVSAGIVVGVLNGWTVTAVALLVTGALMMVASIAAGDFAPLKRSFWQRRSTLAGTNATVSVLSVLVILGLVNFIGARYDSRTDLTDGQLLSLSPASQEVVANLEQPTEAIIFSPAPNPIDKALLDNYRRYNPDFTYEYLDPFANPQMAQQMGVETGGEVFLRAGLPAGRDGESSERTLLVQRIGPQEPLSERQLTNKMAQLSQEDIAVVYFLQGHGEYAIDGSQAGFFEAANRLQDENFTVAPLNLADTGNVPPDADVVIVGGPQQKLFEAEIIALRDYLETGGSLFILIDPQVETGLEVMMSQWGVVPEKTIVIDTSGGGQLVGLGPAAPLVTDYGDHPITDAFDQGRSFFPVARPLQIREVTNVEESPLLFTNQNSHAQSISDDDELEVDPNKAPEGPFSLGVALSRPAIEDPSSIVPEEDLSSNDASDNDASENSDVAEENAANADSEESLAEETPTASSESRMVIIGNSSFATDGLFDQQLNGDVFLNSVSWLSKLETPTLSIRPKEATNRRLNMTVQQQILLLLLALIVFPLLGLIGAGTLWVRRR